MIPFEVAVAKLKESGKEYEDILSLLVLYKERLTQEREIHDNAFNELANHRINVLPEMKHNISILENQIKELKHTNKTLKDILRRRLGDITSSSHDADDLTKGTGDI